MLFEVSKNKGLIISFSMSLKFNPNIGFELFNSGSNLFKSSRYKVIRNSNFYDICMNF